MMDALREFLDMGGYALYVWGAYGLSAAVLVFNAVVPRVRERRLLRSLAGRAEGRRR